MRLYLFSLILIAIFVANNRACDTITGKLSTYFDAFEARIQNTSSVLKECNSFEEIVWYISNQYYNPPVDLADIINSCRSKIGIEGATTVIGRSCGIHISNVCLSCQIALLINKTNILLNKLGIAPVFIGIE